MTHWQKHSTNFWRNINTLANKQSGLNRRKFFPQFCLVKCPCKSNRNSARLEKWTPQQMKSRISNKADFNNCSLYRTINYTRLTKCLGEQKTKPEEDRKTHNPTIELRQNSKERVSLQVLQPKGTQTRRVPNKETWGCRTNSTRQTRRWTRKIKVLPEVGTQQLRVHSTLCKRLSTQAKDSLFIPKQSPRRRKHRSTSWISQRLHKNSKTPVPG